jgi:tetratricopeptide (TPR) repeat protein
MVGCFIGLDRDVAMAGKDIIQQAARKAAQWARSHLLLWIVASTAINTALVVLVTVLVTLPGQSKAAISGWLTVLLVLLVLSITFPVVGHVVERRDQAAAREREQQELAARKEQTRRERIDRLLVHTGGARPPQLSELTDSGLGATPTRYSIQGAAPYVTRGEADQAIRGMLAAPGPPYPFVIVWGATKAGKSRTLAEAIRATFAPDSAVMLPRNGQALFELAQLNLGDLAGNPPAVVVLDNLDPAGLEALTPDVLNLVRQYAVIAATMTSQRRADVLRTGGEVGGVAQAALATVTGEYELSSEPPMGAQRAEAERLYPEERFDGSIAETLVGARELIARYKASHDTHPAACAILRAAIDCRRAGIFRPIAEPELRRLFPLYLPAVRIDLTPTEERLAAALEWAAIPIASQVALLQRANPGQEPSAWIIFDHAVTADEGHGEHLSRPIPAEMWSELTDVVSVDDAFYIGFSADRRDLTAAAIAAFQKARHSSLINIASLAALGLGRLLIDQGDMAGARTAYCDAMSLGHPDIAPLAAIGLGNCLAQKDVDGARAAYQFAVDCGHPDSTPMAANYLGILLSRQGDVAGARVAYELAAHSGHPDVAVQAAMALGGLLEKVGDVAEACAAYQLVIDLGDPEFGPAAALVLGNLLSQQGDVAAARAAFQVAIESNHPDHGSMAAISLGNLLRDQGDVQGARAAYQGVIDSSNPSRKSVAALLLGLMYTQQGDAADACAAYQIVVDSAIPSLKSVAAFLLGVMHSQQGNEEDAHAAYQLVTDSNLDIASIVTSMLTNSD